jgi:hypothetical protein
LLLAAIAKKMHGVFACDAEEVMQCHVLSIEVIVFSGIFYDWLV